MGLLVVSFLVWPIVLFKFGRVNIGHHFLRGTIALLFALCGFTGYAVLPYRLLIFSHYWPLPPWSYIAIGIAYIVGYLLSWKIDDGPLISLM